MLPQVAEDRLSRVNLLEAMRVHRRVLVRVGVKDTGCGIKKEDLHKLFQANSQIKAKELQQGGGSGLGLHLCKEMIKLLGGSIHVNSTPGKGSEFYFVIPFRVGEKPVILHHQPQMLDVPCPDIGSGSVSPVCNSLTPTLGSMSPTCGSLSPKNGSCSPRSGCISPAVSLSTIDFTKKVRRRKLHRTASSPAKGEVKGTVLVVDDVATNCKLLSRRLHSHLWTAETCESGLDCLELVRSDIDRFDSIIMDKEMPEMVVTRELHVFLSYFFVAIVFLSAPPNARKDAGICFVY